MSATPFRYPKIATPTESLVVVDLGRDRMDGQVAACCLQGLVNRASREKVYVTNTYCFDNRGGPPRQAQVSERFLAELYPDLPQERLAPSADREWPGLVALLERFGGQAKGLVVWDPKLEEATIEAATTIAAQTDCIPASPDLARALAPLGVEVAENLRERAFRSNVQCLEWLLETRFAGARKDVAFTWSHMTTDGRSWGAANKDYVTALGLFTFFLDIRDERDRARYRDVVTRYPAGTPIMGWTDERWADALFCAMGHFMVPCISVENLTVHSSFPSWELPEGGVQGPPRAAEVRPDGAYVAFYVADGDNLLHSMVYEPDTIMTSADHGAVPATWVVNPGLVDLAPRLFAWYHARLGTQELAAMMGDGHPSSERRAGFAFYCDMARDYLARSGIRSMKQMAEGEAVAWNVRPYALDSGYAGTDSRGIGPYECHMDGETFHVGSRDLKGDAENVRALVRGAPAGEPVFLQIFCGTAGGDAPAVIKKAAESLKAHEADDGRRYFFLRTMDLAATYRAWKGLPVAPPPA